MNAIKDAAQKVIETAIALAPDSWIPGGTPDPIIGRRQGHVGKPVSRVDGPLKVSGTATFAAEVPMEGLTYAAFAWSTIAKGRIAEIDTREAEQAPGVVLVMTHRNAPKMNRPPAYLEQPKSGSGDGLPVLQDDRIHWNGQPIAIVLASTQEEADHAASLIRARFEAEAGVTSLAEARANGTKQASFFGHDLKDEIGDAEAALAEAPVKVDAIYSTPPHNHNAIEPHAATIAWDGDQLVIHDCVQGVSHLAWTLAEALGIDESQVHVLAPFVGGGFGGKGLWQHQVMAAAAARMAGRPVRVTLSREGVYRIVGGRARTEQRVALGADRDGRFTALIQTGVVGMSEHSPVPEPFILSARCSYAAQNVTLRVEAAYLDMLPNTFMRAPGESVGSFALESGIDELADRLGIDPVELRLRNEPEKDPLTGLEFSSRNTTKAWRDGAERFGWSARNAKPRAQRDGDWFVGVGAAGATYPYYRMPGGAARLTVTKDGKARVEIAAHEMGMGTATAQAQVTADRLGLPLEDVTVAYGDSRMPGVVLAGGSQQTASIGAAVVAAHRKLVPELIKLAGNSSPLAGLAAEDVGAQDGALCRIDDPSVRESYVSILERAGQDAVSVEAEASPPMEMMHWSMHSFGAMFCEARVNAVTGEVRIARFLGSFDCGRILNAKTAASQFRGGIIMGLGLALMEETQFDERSGRIMNPSLAEYHVPVHMDVPQIEVMWTDIADPHSPMGAHGIGEIGITGVGAAVANAVYNATGQRVRHLPITLDKTL